MKESLWQLFLDIKQKVQSYPNVIHSVGTDGQDVFINSDKENDSANGFVVCFDVNTFNKKIEPTFLLTANGKLEKLNGNTDHLDFHSLQLYLPFCLASVIKKDQEFPLILSHFAQSLDGYIAATNGQSQWIGNEENLIHSHRIRALCDAVIIGNNTLLNDKPKLNVRRVKGNDPIRVVIGNKNHCTQSLTGSSIGQIIRFSSDNIIKDSSVDVVKIDCKEQNYIPTSSILKTLYQKGVRSVLIEGGSTTSSLFIKEGNTDIVQYHIAPILLGSGIPNYNHSHTITSIDEGLHFEHYHFNLMGDQIMFTGYL